MKPSYLIIAFIIFISGVYCGVKITFRAVEDAMVYTMIPTKGEGYRSSQNAKKKYSEQTKKLDNE